MISFTHWRLFRIFPVQYDAPLGAHAQRPFVFREDGNVIIEREWDMVLDEVFTAWTGKN